jgi:hypothetical protein
MRNYFSNIDKIIIICYFIYVIVSIFARQRT